VAEGGGRAPPVVFTDYVFDEVITALLVRSRRHELCLRAGQMLLEGKFAKMVEVGPVAFRGAWELFKRRPDKKWSFTDCTSFRTMEALGMDTALTFDSDFEAAGFKAIP
jgi:predicted nucleic acid-binding protein